MLRPSIRMTQEAGRSGSADRWLRTFAFIAAALFLMVIAVPSGASLVHTALLSSTPAAGDTIEAGTVERIELRFSGPVDAASSEIALVDGVGQRRVLTPDPTGDERALAALLGPVEGGGYRVEWRTIAADGHPVSGSFVFYALAPDAAGAVAAELLPPPPPSEALVDATPPISASLLRAGAIATLGALTGLLLFIGWIGPAGEVRLRSVANGLAWAAPVLLIGHAYAWAAYAGGENGPGMLTLLQSSPTGRMELLRIILAVLALWALVLARRPRIAAPFALAAVLVSGYAGHSAVFSPMLLVPGRALHIAAFAVWAGALLGMLLFSRRGADFLAVTRTLSTLSLIAVITLLVSGVAHLLLFPTDLALLARSSYGALIAAKIGGLGVLSALGARNRLKLIPALPEASAEASLRRTVGWELGVMALLIIATGFLSYVPVPQTAASDAPSQLTSLAE
jgi:copper transport protein